MEYPEELILKNFVNKYRIKTFISSNLKFKNDGIVENRQLTRIYNISRQLIYKLISCFCKGEMLETIFEFIIHYYNVQMCILVVSSANYLKVSVEDGNIYKFSTIICNSIKFKNGILSITRYEYFPFNKEIFNLVVPESVKCYVDKVYTLFKNNGRFYFRLKHDSFPQNEEVFINLQHKYENSITLYFRLF